MEDKDKKGGEKEHGLQTEFNGLTFQGWCDWINGEFKDRFLKCIPTINTHKTSQEEYGYLMNQLIIGLRTFYENGVHLEWQEKITKFIFCTNPDALIQQKIQVGDQLNMVRDSLVGGMAPLTLMDLVEKSDKNLK